jgi:hypothetical protein
MVDDIIYYSYIDIIKECKICIESININNPSLDESNISSLSFGDTVYIDIFILHHLYKDFYKINVPFVLITGKGELSINNVFKTKEDMNNFINNPYLLHWYCINNNTFNNVKITSIPIGLEYVIKKEYSVELLYNYICPIKEDYHNYIYEIQKTRPLFYERHNKCYLNYYNDKNILYCIEREKVLKEIPSHLLYIENEKLEKRNVLLNMSQFKFIICNLINTLDNSFIFESLCIGSIPIILSSHINKLYEDLPVLIIEKWSDISQELLDKTIEDFKNKYTTFKYEKLTLKYWLNKINNHKNEQEENYCKYYSSHGIMKSCDVYGVDQRLSNEFKQNTIRIEGHARIIKNFDLYKIKENSIVYVHIDAIYQFYKYCLPVINHKIIVVSGDNDHEPESVLNNTADFFNFINNPKIIHWFSTNSIIKHPKFTIIPYGLDYHTLSRYRGDVNWACRQISSVHQEKELEEILNMRQPFWKKYNKCYVNFHFAMKTKYSYDRHNALKQIPKELLYIEEYPLLRKNSWINMSLFQFVISPHGNGLDCIRTWEALIFGCIPIVRKSPIDVLYEDLPVLIVEEWSDITQELLDKTIEDFKNKNNLFKYEKLTLKYWVDRIKSYRINN